MNTLTNEDKEYITKTLQTVIFNMTDCIGLFKWFDNPDSKREIIKETLERDLEYLMKLNDFVKDKLK